MRRVILLLTSCVTLLLAAGGDRIALDAIRADELKGDLSFLASDTLRGRFTPSPELDVAAEFIASKFRAAGLEPGGNQEYFQTAEMVSRHVSPALSALHVNMGNAPVLVPAEAIEVREQSSAARILRAPVIVVAPEDGDQLDEAAIKGKVVLVAQPEFDRFTDQQKEGLRALHRMVVSSGALLEVRVVQKKPPAAQQRLLSLPQAQERRVPEIAVTSERLWNVLTQSKKVPRMTLSVRLGPPNDRKVVLKNVIGILRGSDPMLKNTCVLLTAHYDHIGTADTAGPFAVSKPKDANDRIYNGANDDGSGTVSVIEIARAFARLNLRPRRSIVFMTFFGEELGEVGAKFYASHPIFPPDKTVADLNLEQLGRTDSTTGPQIGTVTMTGYQYSDLAKFIEQAGRETGIKIYEDQDASDEYFVRSDNEALAKIGIPAHTIAVAYEFPDYHAVGDEWQKIDYDNMAKVDRMLALAVWNLANDQAAPQWNADNPKAAPYRKVRGNIQ